jgi:hypothetical protein
VNEELRAKAKRFDAWSFMRDVLIRGAAIERDSDRYRLFSARLDAAARELADRLKPHLAANPADDGEAIDAAYWEAMGWKLDGPAAVGRYRTTAGRWELCTKLRDAGGWRFIAWVVGDETIPDESVSLVIRTRGDVRRLLAALGVRL